MNNNTYINIQIIINNVVDLIELFWETAKYANLCELLYFLQYCNHGYKMRPTIQMLSMIERSAPSKKFRRYISLGRPMRWVWELEDGLHWTGCSRTSTPAARQSGTADTPSHLHINRRVGGPFPCKLDLVSTSSYFREVKKGFIHGVIIILWLVGSSF